MGQDKRKKRMKTTDFKKFTDRMNFKSPDDRIRTKGINMTVYIGNAVGNEKGTANGGEPGDTGLGDAI